ncbi:protein FAM186A [Alexandromys fortis]|uniref:protein FAM186A n=1 Tax=Alexandromys fortis TaxID=100897 RepID=UPI00215303C8|nr:protein FAM186A [Microtus fortis]
MFTKRQGDFNSESDTDNEAKDPSIKKRKSEGSLDNSKGSNLEIPLSVKAVIRKIEQAKLLRAKEGMWNFQEMLRASDTSSMTLGHHICHFPGGRKHFYPPMIGLDKVLLRASRDILTRLIQIMNKVELIMTRYTIDSSSPGRKGSFTANQRKKRKIFLEKIAEYINTIDMRERILIKLLSWLEEWNFILSEVAEIDIEDYYHWVAEMEIMPETLKNIDGNVNTLCQITVSLFEERKRQKKKLLTRGTLWKAWKERVVKRPATAHALRPDQMICDQFALNTKVSEIQDMLQELISKGMFSKLENNAIKYISATMLNLSKALSTVNEELKLLLSQVTNLVGDEEKEEEEEEEKEIPRKAFQELCEENEMLHQRLKESEEKSEQLIRIKNFLGRQLLFPSVSFRTLVAKIPTGKDMEPEEIDSLLNKELENIIDESQKKGVRVPATKWDSTMAYVAQGEAAPAEGQVDYTQKKPYFPAPQSVESLAANLEEERIVLDIETSEFDLQTLDMMQKDEKSFLEGKLKSQGVQSGTGSMWDRLKVRSQYTVGKSPVPSEAKIEPTVRPKEKEVELPKTIQPEPPELHKPETKEKKPVPGKTEDTPSSTKVHGKLQSRTPKQTTISPEGRGNLESFQRAILAFLREKMNNVGKAFDPKSIQEEEDALGKAEVEKLNTIKLKMEEYIQKVTETVTKTLRTYKDVRKKQFRDIVIKQKLALTTPQQLPKQISMGSKAEIRNVLLSEMTDPVIRKFVQTLLDELEGEREGTTAGRRMEEKQEQQKQEEEAWKEEQRLQRESKQKQRGRERAEQLEEWRQTTEGSEQETDKEKPKAVRDAEDSQRPKGSKWKQLTKTEFQAKELSKMFTQSAVVLTPRWMKVLKPLTSQVQLFQADPDAVEHPKEKQPSSSRTLLDFARPLPRPIPELAQIASVSMPQAPSGSPSHELTEKAHSASPTAGQEQALGSQLTVPGILEQTSTPEQMQTPQTTAEQVQISGATVTQRTVLPLQQIQAKDITLTSPEVLDQGITLTPEQAQALGITLTPEQAKAQRIHLTPQQAQTLGITLTPEQTKAQKISLTPQQAQTLGITLTPWQAQGLGLILTPEQTKAQRAQALGIALTPQQVKVQGISLTPQQGLALGMTLTPEQAQTQGIILTPEQAQALGLTLTPEQAQALGITLTVEQARAQRISLTPEQAQALGITLSPEQAQFLGLTLTPQQAQINKICLTPQQAQALGITLTPEQANTLTISLTPKQAQALGITLTVEQARAQRISLTPEQAQALGITLSPEQAQALGITEALGDTFKEQRVSLTPEQTQALGITPTPKQGPPQEISLSPEDAQALGLTLTPQQAQINKIYLTPQQTQALGITLTPEQANTLTISLTPQQAQALGITLTVEQARAQRISLTPEQAQFLGLTLTPQQAQINKICLTPQQAQALGITLTPEQANTLTISLTPKQAQALGITLTVEQARAQRISLTPEQAQALGITLSPEQAQALGLTLTPQQAQINKIYLTPQQAQALGITLTPEQANTLTISLTPQQVQALGITLTVEQARAQRISLTPEQAQALGITLLPEQTHTLGISLSPQQAQDLGITLTPRQAKVQKICLTPEQAQALGITFTPEQARDRRSSLTPEQARALGLILSPVQARAQRITLSPEQAEALGITLSPEQAEALGISFTSSGLQKQGTLPPKKFRGLDAPLTPKQAATLRGRPTTEQIQPLKIPIIPESIRRPKPAVASKQTQTVGIPLHTQWSQQFGVPLPQRQGKALGITLIPGQPQAFEQVQALQPPRTPWQSPLLGQLGPGETQTLMFTITLDRAQDLGVIFTQEQTQAAAVTLTSEQVAALEDALTEELAWKWGGLIMPEKAQGAANIMTPEQVQAPGIAGRLTPPPTAGVLPTSGKFPGGSAVYKDLLLSRLSPYQPPAIGEQIPYMQGQQMVTAELSISGGPQRISPSSVPQKWSGAVPPPKPFPTEKIRIAKVPGTSEETGILQDSFDMKPLGMFQPYVTGSGIPESKLPHVGLEKSTVSPTSLSTQLSQTSQALPSARGQRPWLPAIDKPWILTPASDTRKAKAMGFPLPAQLPEDRYFVDVEAQRKNLVILNEAAQTSGFPPQYHTIARNLIIELLHMNTVRLGYLCRKYVAYRLIQLARNNITKRLKAIQNTGKGYEAQNLYIMLDRIDQYQKRVMRFWTDKQKELEQRRKQCLWSMMQVFSQIEKVFKLNLSQPVPLVSGFKQIPDFTKTQSPVLELFTEDNKKPDIFKTFGYVQTQVESIWNADLSTSSYPIMEKTSLNTLWTQLGGYPDIPRLLQLDIQWTFRKALASLRSQ